MAIEPEGLQKNIPVINNLKIEEQLLNPSESSIKPEKALHDYAKMVSELSPEQLDKLATAVIRSSDKYYKMKLLRELLSKCAPEQAEQVMSILLNKTIDEAIPEIMALLGTQPTTEVEEPTIKF